MRCIGLDVASVTGWAHGESSGSPTYGIFKLPKLTDVPDEQALGGLYGSVLALVRENEIELATIEAPLPDIKRKNKRGILLPVSRRGSKVLLMYFGVALAALRNGGCKRIYQVAPSTWRKAVLGNGYPDNPKQAAIDYCRLAFNCNVPDHNAAEAVCLWAWGLGQIKLL